MAAMFLPFLPNIYLVDAGSSTKVMVHIYGQPVLEVFIFSLDLFPGKIYLLTT